jgi:hypothetical protein
MEIVGVVADAKYESLRDEPPRQVFVAAQQADWATEMTAYVRTTMPSDAVFTAIRQEVASLDPTMPVYDMTTMEDQLDRSLSIERLVAYLSSSFGALATILAFVGLYGVTAFGVSQRSSEIGLRMALGARATAVVWMVLKEVLVLTGIGVALALPTAWWLSELVRSQLFDVAPRDPVTMALSASGLLAVAMLAGGIPAHRASRLNPVTVLRDELDALGRINIPGEDPSFYEGNWLVREQQSGQHHRRKVGIGLDVVRVKDVQSIGPAEVHASLPVLEGEANDELLGLNAVLGAVVGECSGERVEPVDAFSGAHPDPASLVGQDTVNDIAAEPVPVRVGGEPPRVSIELAHSATQRADPQVPRLILDDRAHERVAQRVRIPRSRRMALERRGLSGNELVESGMRADP